MQVIVYAVDDAEVPAVLAAFHAGAVTADYGLGSTPDRLDLGFVYSTAEVAAGSALSLAKTLMRNAPTAAFVIWQDPSYPDNGSYVGHVLGVGVLEAECNVHGRLLIPLGEVIPFFSTSRRTAWTQTEDNTAGQVRQAAEVLDALALLARRLPGAPSAE